MMGSGPDVGLQMRQIACQELLTRDGICSGWLRGKTILHKLGEAMDEKINRPGFAKQLTSKISWQRRFVVAIDGYLHIYANETSKRPSNVIDLCGFQNVEKDENLKVKEVPWPFKISSESSKKVMNYGAMSEPELKKWIEAVTRGIDEAKKSGRKPPIYEKKEAILEPTKKPKKRLPSVPSAPHDDSDNSDDHDDLYDYVHDLEEEHKQRLSLEDSAEKAENAEAETVTVPRRVLPLPQLPGQNIEPEKCKTAVTKPCIPSKKTLPTEPTTAMPGVPSRKNSLTTPSNTKPSVPSRSNSNKEPKTTRMPLPKEPNPANNDSDNGSDYEHPKEDDLVKEATWTGPLEEGTEIMKSATEDGIFMIREATAGKGEKTLQVKSDEAVRKYRITKEGDKLRMAGGSMFNSMSELLSFYQKNSIPNHSTKLTKPYSKVE